MFKRVFFLFTLISFTWVNTASAFTLNFSKDLLQKNIKIDQNISSNLKTDEYIENRDFAELDKESNFQYLDKNDLNSDLELKIEKNKNLAENHLMANLRSYNWESKLINSENRENPSLLNKLNFNVDSYTGSALYSYSFDFPKGRNNLAPDLTLFYNSQNKNDFSFLAHSWSLNGLFYIQRDKSAGSDELYTSNHFLFNNEKLVAIDLKDDYHGTYKLLVDNGRFYRFTYLNDNTWLLLDKDGKKYYFQLHEDSNWGTYKWYLNKVEDQEGNYYEIHYKKSRFNLYLPDFIEYTKHPKLKAIYKIYFIYKDNPIKRISYAFGRKEIYDSLLSRLDLYVENELRLSYSFEYKTIDTINLLVKIRKQAYKNNQAVSDFYEDKFTYNEKPLNNWKYQVFNSYLPFSLNYFSGVVLADLNRDALADIAYSADIQIDKNNYYQERYAFLNNKDLNQAFKVDREDFYLDFPIYKYYLNHYSFYSSNLLLDANADSYLDILENDKIDLYDSFVDAYFPYSVPAVWQYINNVKTEIYSIADLNADNRPDFIENKTGKIYLNKGDFYTISLSSKWINRNQITISKSNYANKGIRLIDINADGLVDIVQSYRDFYGNISKNVYLNNGQGYFIKENNYELPVYLLDEKNNISENKLAVYFLDLNNDNFPDILDINNKTAYLNLAGKWQENSNYYISAKAIEDFNFRIANIDTEQLADIIWTKKIAEKKYQLFAYLNNNARNFLLKTIENSQRIKIQIDYVNARSEENNNVNSNYLVKKVSLFANGNNVYWENYNYSNSSYYTYDNYNYGLTGFAKVEKINSSGLKELFYYHQGDEDLYKDKYLYENQDHFVLQSYLYAHLYIDLQSNKLLKADYQNWDYFANGKNYFVYLKSQINANRDRNDKMRYLAIEYSYNTFTENLQKISKIKEVQTDGIYWWQYKDLDPSDNLYTYYSYAQDPKNEIYSAVSNLLISDYKNNVLVKKHFYYDNLSQIGVVYKGLLSREAESINSNEWRSKTYSYNDYGLLIKESDYLNNYTEYIYDQNQNFLIKEILPRSNFISFTYDPYCQKVIYLNKNNLYEEAVDYDAYCRETAKYVVANGQKILLNRTEYNYKQYPFKISKYIYHQANKYQKVVSYFDSFFNEILTLTSSEKGILAFKRNYNNLALLTGESDIFLVDSWDWQDYNVSWKVNYDYDLFSRLKSIDLQNQNYTVNYFAFSSDVYKNQQLERRLYFNSDNKIIKVFNALNQDTVIYKYNLLGRLIQVQKNNLYRNFTYDRLGLLIRNEDFHSLNDNNYLITFYKWDKNGRLLEKYNDKNSVHIRYSYDGNGNLILKEDLLKPDIRYSYNYDALDRLVKVFGPDYQKVFKYNFYGQLTSKSLFINNQQYSYFYNYDRQGILLSKEYPDKSKLEYFYNARYLLNSLDFLDAQQGRKSIIKMIDYNENARPLKIIYADDLVHSYKYDSYKRVILEKVSNADDSIIFWSKIYNYDDNSNLISAEEQFSNHKYTFTNSYDDLDRLISSKIEDINNNVLEDKSFKYAQNNRIKLINRINFDIDDYLYSNEVERTNAFTLRLIKHNGKAYKYLYYDDNGNLKELLNVLSNEKYNYFYDSFNRLVKVQKNKQSLNLFYDENDLLIKSKAKNNHYYFDNYEFDDKDAIVVHYDYFDLDKDNGLVYKFKDQFNNIVFTLRAKDLAQVNFVYNSEGQLIYQNGEYAYLHHNNLTFADFNLEYVLNRYKLIDENIWLTMDNYYIDFPLLLNNRLLVYSEYLHPYAVNNYNDYKFIDWNGDIPDLLPDIISIVFSLYDFITDPGIKTLGILGYDVVAAFVPGLIASKTAKLANWTLTPIKNLFKQTKIYNYFWKYLYQNRKKADLFARAINRAKELLKGTAYYSEKAFSVLERFTVSTYIRVMKVWDRGSKVQHSAANFVGHYIKHMDELAKFNISTMEDYLNFASKIAFSGEDVVETSLGTFYKVVDKGDIAYFNKTNNLLIIVNKSTNKIRTFYEVTVEGKIKYFLNLLSKFGYKIWGIISSVLRNLFHFA